VFVQQLRKAAGILAPFCELPVAGSLRWDGSSYQPAVGSERSEFDPYAAKWWAGLTVVAAMLDGVRQVPAQQKTYLQRLVFGGMGSFQDFNLDERRGTARARAANQQLVEVRAALFEGFREL
jgi:hypothetical protein